ncbi:MAG TPA: hypothetical protein VL025_10155 [Thermoanaerobaculia bacterium]|nr:hypothetical protein [Thermoanaerobaculia bacterium]
MAEDRGITHWDPPPPSPTAFVVAGAFILASIAAVAMGQLMLGAGLAFVAVVAGLINLGQTFRMNLRVDTVRLNRQRDTQRLSTDDSTDDPSTAEAEFGGGGILPDPPPPRMLMMVAFKAFAIAFAVAGVIAALSDCEPLPFLALALVTAVVALALDRRKK